MILVVFFTGCLLFALAYRFYGRFLAKEMELDDSRPTPAHTMCDNVDYVPTSNMILFGHHFSAIAGAGPIVGPIIAALAFGWLPAVLWIIIGAILIGGLHDFMVMVASIRNKGRSIGQICKNFLSPPAYYMFLFFILLTLIYVIIVFLDITASTFVPPSGTVHVEGSEQVVLEARQGGVVATASMFYIALAVLFGLCIYKMKMSAWLGTLIFVPLVFGGLWLGNQFPCTADMVPQVFGSAKNFWTLILMIYCLFAAMLPVWILLQPRDYLASYLLYACLLGGAIGLLIYGVTGHSAPAYPMFIGFTNDKLGFIFPALFVTIACGAVSGFHAVVASGTSAKQLRNESSARVVGYGSMLVEGVLALLAVATVMIIAGKVPAGQTPVVTFGNGLGAFMQTLGISETFAKTFAMMAVSTFLLTTLDACTRLARFIIEEIFNLGNQLWPRLLSTAAVLILPALVVFQQIPGPNGQLIPAWQAIWPVFGACNQLLAALALLVIFTWLKRNGKRAFYVAIPMVFMFVTTLTALIQLTYKNLLAQGALFDLRHIIGSISLVLLVLAVTIILDTIRSFVKKTA
ncbi:MAG: carbon starvation CstA family protein [Kiritimatiellales bacterium]